MRGHALQNSISHAKRIEPLVRRLAPAELRSLRSKAGRGKVSGAASCLAARRRCGPGLFADSKLRISGGKPRRILAASLALRHAYGACAGVLRLPGGQIEIEMPLTALAQRPSGMHADPLTAATHGFATRGAQELEQILNERRMTYFDFHLPQLAPTSCRTPSSTLTLVRSGQPSSEASQCVRVPSRRLRAVLGYFRGVGQAHGASEEPSRLRRVS